MKSANYLISTGLSLLSLLAISGSAMATNANAFLQPVSSEGTSQVVNQPSLPGLALMCQIDSNTTSLAGAEITPMTGPILSTGVNNTGALSFTVEASMPTINLTAGYQTATGGARKVFPVTLQAHNGVYVGTANIAFNNWIPAGSKLSSLIFYISDGTMKTNADTAYFSGFLLNGQSIPINLGN